MATKTSPNKKSQQTAMKSAKKSQNEPRTRKLNRRNKRKVDKKVKRSQPLPAAYKIFWRSLKHLWAHKKLFIGILLIYGVLNILLVKGVAGNFQIGSLKDTLESTFGDQLGTWQVTSSLFGVLIGSGGSTNGEAGSLYQLVLLVIFSMAIIWSLRHTYEKKIKIRVRDAFYKGMYPLIPLVLVLLVIVAQLIPMLIGLGAYTAVRSNHLAVTIWEKGFWLAFLLALSSASVYMLSSSVFAFYIATLPDMTPIRALKAARKMVKFRRWAIIRKVIFLPVALFVVAAAVLMPLIIVFPLGAEILYMFGSMVILAVVHSYGYALYRELL